MHYSKSRENLFFSTDHRKPSGNFQRNWGWIYSGVQKFGHPWSKSLWQLLSKWTEVNLTFISCPRIFPHSSWQDTSRNILQPPCMYSSLRSIHRSSIIQSGDWGGHSKTFIRLSWRYFMVELKVCFGSLSCWNIQSLFNYNVWTDLQKLASRISWDLVEPMLPSTCTIFPVPPAATQRQNNSSIFMLDSWQCILLYKGFALFSPNIRSWWWPKSSIMVSSGQSTLCRYHLLLVVSPVCGQDLVLQWPQAKQAIIACLASQLVIDDISCWVTYVQECTNCLIPVAWHHRGGKGGGKAGPSLTGLGQQRASKDPGTGQWTYISACRHLHQFMASLTILVRWVSIRLLTESLDDTTAEKGPPVLLKVQLDPWSHPGAEKWLMRLMVLIHHAVPSFLRLWLAWSFSCSNTWWMRACLRWPSSQGSCGDKQEQ